MHLASYVPTNGPFKQFQFFLSGLRMAVSHRDDDELPNALNLLSFPANPRE